MAWNQRNLCKPTEGWDGRYVAIKMVTNLCFDNDDETQFELVLKFIQAHCEGCKITVHERPEE
jgi:hypothetical protein